MAPVDKRDASGGLRSKARGAARATALGAWTLGATQTALVHLHMTHADARAELLQTWVRRWARGLIGVLGVEEHVVGAPPPIARGARLVVANHRSPFDILLMLRHCGGSVLARADLQGWPLFGRAAREGGTIFVDRNDPRSGARAIRAIRRHLADGHTVTVFPEGTTHRGDEVRAFQAGAISAARGTETEILPVGIAYEPGAEFVDESFGEYVARMSGRARIPVGLCFGTPRPARESREVLVRELHAEVQALVHRARSALEPTHLDRAQG